MSATEHAAVPGLRQNKRYITTHDDIGKSVYAESPPQHFNLVPGFGGAARSFAIASVPAVLDKEVDIHAYRAEDGPSSYKAKDIVAPQPGANIMVCDLSPGGKSYMHRTVSIDYSICVQGELDHELDGGAVVRLYPGVSHMGRQIRAERSTKRHRTTSCNVGRFIDGPIPQPPSQRALLR